MLKPGLFIHRETFMQHFMQHLKNSRFYLLGFAAKLKSPEHLFKLAETKCFPHNAMGIQWSVTSEITTVFSVKFLELGHMTHLHQCYQTLHQYKQGTDMRYRALHNCIFLYASVEKPWKNQKWNKASLSYTTIRTVCLQLSQGSDSNKEDYSNPLIPNAETL